MTQLYPEKLLSIITTQALEERLVRIIRAHHVSGYTVLTARGAGSTGMQTRVLDADTNVQLMVILPESRLSPLLDEIATLLKQGHHLTLFVADVGVLDPAKFEEPM